MTTSTPPPGVATQARLRELFDACSELAPAARAQWLRELDLDSVLQRRLEAMLAADASAAGVLETPLDAWTQAPAAADDDVEALVGTEIGGFQVSGLLGHGGSSVVFRAERDVGGATQRVALKLMRHGLFSNEAQRRFRREQAILAQLTHPDIAHLIDAGISSAGIPYIAMELVEGATLAEHAHQRSLDDAQRLRLLAQVARAVDAAHRMLVVHRDLKPSNVLVTTDGRVKVLDFGIAKLLADEDETATQHLSLTPGYAAPEQYQSGAVTTAVDVFALGVIASELLVGARLGADAALPVDGAAASTARVRWRALDPDLATLLRTALAREPAQRYASARHFADDIERFLRNQPISARPPSAAYRARKFLARHRLGVGVGAVVVLALIAALGIALREATIARAELARADSMRDFMFDAFADAEPSVPRDGPATVLDAVHRAIATSNDATGTEPRARIELRTRLAQVLQRQGDIEGALALFAQTRDDAIRLLGADDRLSLELSELLIGNTILRGRFDEARAALDALYRRVPPNNDGLRIALLSRSAVLATKVRDRDRALTDARNALAMARASGDPEVVRQTLNDYAIVMYSVDALPEAVAAYEEVLALNRRLFGDNHQKVANVQASLARAYRRMGDMVRAEAAARSAVAIDRQLYAGDNWNMALHLNSLMLILDARGAYEEELGMAREALRIDRATLGDEHPETLIALYGVGTTLARLERYAEGLPELREGLAGSEKVFGPTHWATAVRRAALGYSLAMSGDGEAGTAQLERAIADFEALADPDLDKLANAIEKRVRVALQQRDGASALQWVDRLAQYSPHAPVARASWPGRVACLRGEAQLALAQLPASIASLQECGTAIAAEPGVDAVLRTEQELLLATALLRADDTAQSRLLAARARAGWDAMPFVPQRLVTLEAALPR